MAETRRSESGEARVAARFEGRCVTAWPKVAHTPRTGIRWIAISQILSREGPPLSNGDVHQQHAAVQAAVPRLERHLSGQCGERSSRRVPCGSRDFCCSPDRLGSNIGRVTGRQDGISVGRHLSWSSLTCPASATYSSSRKISPRHQPSAHPDAPPTSANTCLMRLGSRSALLKYVNHSAEPARLSRRHRSEQMWRRQQPTPPCYHHGRPFCLSSPAPATNVPHRPQQLSKTARLPDQRHPRNTLQPESRQARESSHEAC